jgi:hypothetical protein
MDPIAAGLAQLGVDFGFKALMSIGGNGAQETAP